MRGCSNARPSFRRSGRRIADRAADCRDRCRQSQRLHPDQSHLDHRRPDRARLAPVPRRPQARGRCRPERQPGRRQDPGAGPARGRGTLRLDYAQFLELEMFTRFGGVTDTHVKDKIARGRRIRGVLTQPQYAPTRLVDEVALVMALQNGILDAFPLEISANSAPIYRLGSTARPRASWVGWSGPGSLMMRRARLGPRCNARGADYGRPPRRYPNRERTV